MKPQQIFSTKRALGLNCALVRSKANGSCVNMDPHRFAHSLNDLVVSNMDHNGDNGLATLLQTVVDLFVCIQRKVVVLETDHDACRKELARSSATCEALTRRLSTVKAEKKALRTALRDGRAKSNALETKVADLTQAKRFLTDHVRRLTAEVNEYKDHVQEELKSNAHERLPFDGSIIIHAGKPGGPASVGKDTAGSSHMSTIDDSASEDLVVLLDRKGLANGGNNDDDDDEYHGAGRQYRLNAGSYVLHLDGDPVRKTSYNLSNLAGLLDPDNQGMDDERSIPVFTGDEEYRPLNDGERGRLPLPPPHGFWHKIALLNLFDRRAKDERCSFHVDGDDDSDDSSSSSTIGPEQSQVYKCDSGGDSSATSGKLFQRWFLSLVVGSSGKIGRSNGKPGEEAEDDSPLITVDDEPSQIDHSRPFWLIDQWVPLQVE
jgi:hypothetical protein